MRIDSPIQIKMDENEFDRIDEFIVDILTKSSEPLTTYKIAKKAGIAWSTANIHCYKLKSMGVLKESIETPEYGRKQVIWMLMSKTPKLSEYIK